MSYRSPECILVSLSFGCLTFNKLRFLYFHNLLQTICDIILNLTSPTNLSFWANE